MSLAEELRKDQEESSEILNRAWFSLLGYTKLIIEIKCKEAAQLGQSYVIIKSVDVFDEWDCEYYRDYISIMRNSGDDERIINAFKNFTMYNSADSTTLMKLKKTFDKEYSNNGMTFSLAIKDHTSLPGRYWFQFILSW